MKKNSSLAEQVQQAQQEIRTWPDWLKISTQLEGRDAYYAYSSSTKLKEGAREHTQFVVAKKSK